MPPPPGQHTQVKTQEAAGTDAAAYGEGCRYICVRGSSQLEGYHTSLATTVKYDPRHWFAVQLRRVLPQWDEEREWEEERERAERANEEERADARESLATDCD
jgi:hypothetical protein